MSMRRVFREEMQRKEFAGLGLAALKEKERGELEEAIAANDKRNSEIAQERKIREVEEMKALEKEVLNEITDELRKQEDSIKLRTQEVLKAIEECDQYVTRENITEKLSEALENPVVYDFAIDLQGKKLYVPKPTKYLEHKPGQQKGRMYDVTLGLTEEIAVDAK